LAVAEEDLFVRVHTKWTELVDDLGIGIHGIGTTCTQPREERTGNLPQPSGLGVG
jgi:hypothetical protein